MKAGQSGEIQQNNFATILLYFNSVDRNFLESSKTVEKFIANTFLL